MEKIIAVGLTLTFSCIATFPASVAAEVDYSKCAEFFNNGAATEKNPKGYRTKRTGAFVPRRWRYIPFDLQDDGSIKLHSGASQEILRHSNGVVQQTTIVHQSPSLEELEMQDAAALSGETRAVETIVERDAQGNITSITENRGLISPEEEGREIHRAFSWVQEGPSTNLSR